MKCTVPATCGWSGMYAWPGYLLYLDGDTLLGLAFDTAARGHTRYRHFTVRLTDEL